VAREDALKLARLIAVNPGRVRAKLAMPNEIGGAVEQENVVGEIRGYEKVDEVVILGAHLDSWELGSGALDNGCNAALVIEAARAIKAMGLAPKRSIRFILFSGEEQGTVGSFAYVKAHMSELDKMRGVIIFDSGSGRVSAIRWAGARHGGRTSPNPEVAGCVGRNAAHERCFVRHGQFRLSARRRSDVRRQPGHFQLSCHYHAASDTFDKVDQRELKLNTVIAALTVWGVADRAEPLGKRLSRVELDEVVKQTGLDEQMKLLGYWEHWQSGARGRRRKRYTKV